MSYFIGLMSGTSCDGMDALLANIEPNTAPTVIATHQHVYSHEQQNTLRALATATSISWEALSHWDNAIARHAVTAVEGLLKKADVNARDIVAIGSHGHTLQHQPQPNGFSYQIGDPNWIAEHTGITCVADFRRRDIAAQGQGAPLVPAFQHACFATDTPRQWLNLGGIANLTVMPYANTPLRGFDCGPANGLLDEVIQQHGLGAYDAHGQYAASGKVVEPLLKAWLDLPYLQQPPPKSTGRELFNMDSLMQHARANGVAISPSLPDLMATLNMYSVRCIALAIEQWGHQKGELLVHGGGTFNDHLMSTLRCELPTLDIKTTAAIGIEPEWLEGLAFAWLAHRSLSKQSGNEPCVTGANDHRVLGGVYWA